jgi:8-oxo-dGTP pyrophosphatase MutT (NUDIX family)
MINNIKNKVAKVIIYNDNFDFLLQLRDGNPKIEFPFYWNLIGGVVEKNELPTNAILREIWEELNLNISNIDLFLESKYKDTYQYIYKLNLNIDANRIKLNEGISLGWFNYHEIENIEVAFNYKEILRRFWDDYRIYSSRGSQ